MKHNLFALLVLILILVLFPAAVFGYRAVQRAGDGTLVIEMAAKAPKVGGFVPDRLNLVAGQTVRLRVTSPDVVHGFAIPELGVDIAEIYPGRPVEVTITPQEPGRYTFACTRWCGVDHWRMRGVIEVEPAPGQPPPPTPEKPLFERLGIDIDAMRHAPHELPTETPSVSRGALLAGRLHRGAADPAKRRSLSPAAAFHQLRGIPENTDLTDGQVWDVVAWAWQKDVTPTAMLRAESLYARDCAACHGENGRGDGVVGKKLPGMSKMDATMPGGPANFTDAGQMLSASDALLQGKLLRGGMGTGMPEFGSLYTDEELWAMVTYLRTFLSQK